MQRGQETGERIRIRSSIDILLFEKTLEEQIGSDLLPVGRGELIRTDISIELGIRHRDPASVAALTRSSRWRMVIQAKRTRYCTGRASPDSVPAKRCCSISSLKSARGRDARRYGRYKGWCRQLSSSPLAYFRVRRVGPDSHSES